MSSDDIRAHLARDGKSRCGNGTLLALAEEHVTCARCLAMMAGTYGVGHRKPEEPCGTLARYRWHLRHEGKPVRCQACLGAERRRNADRRWQALYRRAS